MKIVVHVDMGIGIENWNNFICPWDVFKTVSNIKYVLEATQ